MYIMLKQPLALVALLCLCTVGAGAPEIDPAAETMTAEESIQWAVNEYGDNLAMTPSFARQRCPPVVFHFRDCQLLKNEAGSRFIFSPSSAGWQSPHANPVPLPRGGRHVPAPRDTVRSLR